MGILDKLLGDMIRDEVARQLADPRGPMAQITKDVAEQSMAIDQLAQNQTKHAIRLTQIEVRQQSMREQMTADEDYTRQLARRVSDIENTTGEKKPLGEGH